MFEHLETKAAYLALLAIAIVCEHLLVYEPWRKHELARRVLGIGTVMAFALLLAIAGVIDVSTWAFIMAAFGVAGAITGALHISRQAGQTRARVSQLHEAIHGEAEQANQ